MAPEDDHDSHSHSQITSLKKQLEVSLARTGLLEKENHELRQEVARLKAQILSLKAHDNERKSMLWKKLQNADASQQQKVSEQTNNLDGEVLEVGKERSMMMMTIKVPKPPPPKPTTTSVISQENKFKVPSTPAGPAPPPPPLPSKLLAGSKSIRRVPEVVELYRSLTRKDANMESNRTSTTATPAIAFNKNMIGEIENRSSYLSAIKSDVKKQKEFINFLIKEVESAAFTDVSDVETFVKWLDEELSSLVDERAVLKHFPQWPERKADAMREAACNYKELKNLESEVSSFKDNQKESLQQAIRRMQALQERLEQSVNNTERIRESTSKRYRDFQIPWEWMLDTGLIGQMKLSSLKLAKAYMKRITKELQSNECPREQNLMLQGVRFAYRVHQFAGGFDSETIRAFDELKKVGLGSHK